MGAVKKKTTWDELIKIIGSHYPKATPDKILAHVKRLIYQYKDYYNLKINHLIPNFYQYLIDPNQFYLNKNLYKYS